MEVNTKPRTTKLVVYISPCFSDTDQRSYVYDDELFPEERALVPKCGQHLLESIAPTRDKGSSWEQSDDVFESVSVESQRRREDTSQDKVGAKKRHSSSRDGASEANLEKSYSIGTAQDKTIDPKSSLTFTDSGKGTLCSTDTYRNQFSTEICNKHQINDKLSPEKFMEKKQPFHNPNAYFDSHNLSHRPESDGGKNSSVPIKCNSRKSVEKGEPERPHGTADGRRMSSPHRDKPSCTHLETVGSLDRQTTDRNPPLSLRATSYSGKYSWLERSTSLGAHGDKPESSNTDSDLDIGSWERLDKTLSNDLADLYRNFDFSPCNKDSGHASRITASLVTTDPASAEHQSEARTSPELKKTHATNREKASLAKHGFIDATTDEDRVSEVELLGGRTDCGVTRRKSSSPNNLSNRSETSERRNSNISLKLAGSFWTRQSTGCSGDEESLNQWVSDFCDSTVRQINELIAERKSSLTKLGEDKQFIGQEAQLHDFREAVREGESVYPNSSYEKPNSGNPNKEPSHVRCMASDNVAEKGSSDQSYTDRSPRRRRSSSSNGSLFESTIRQLNEMIASKIISAANSVQDMLVTVIDQSVASEESHGNHQAIDVDAQCSDLMELVKSAFSEREYCRSVSEISDVSKSSQVSHKSLPREAVKHAVSSWSNNGQSPRHCSSSNGNLFENTIRQLNEMISNRILSAGCSDENMQGVHEENNSVTGEQGWKASDETKDISNPDRRDSPKPCYSLDGVNDQAVDRIVERSSRSIQTSKEAIHTDMDELAKEAQGNLSIRHTNESAVLQLNGIVAKKVNPSETRGQQTSQGYSLDSSQNDEESLLDEVITSNSSRQYNPSSSPLVFSCSQDSPRRPGGERGEDPSIIRSGKGGSGTARRLSANSGLEGDKSNDNSENSPASCIVSKLSKESERSNGGSPDGLVKTDTSINSSTERAVRKLAEMIDRKQMSAVNSKEVLSRATSDNSFQKRQIEPDCLSRDIGPTESDGRSVDDGRLFCPGSKRSVEMSSSLSGGRQAFERAFNSGSINEMHDASLAEFNNLILTKMLAENGGDDAPKRLPEKGRFQNLEDDRALFRQNARSFSQCSSTTSGLQSAVASVCPVCEQVYDNSGNVALDQGIPGNQQSSRSDDEVIERSVDGRPVLVNQDRANADRRIGLNTESIQSVAQKSLTSSWSKLDRDELDPSHVGSNNSLHMRQCLPSQSVRSQRSSTSNQQSSCPKYGMSISRTANDRDQDSVHTYTVSSGEELIRGLQVNDGAQVILDLPSTDAANGEISRNKHRADTSVKNKDGVSSFGLELQKPSNDGHSMGSKQDLKCSLAENCFSSSRRLAEDGPPLRRGSSMNERYGDMRSENTADSERQNGYKTSSTKLSIPSDSALGRKSSVASASSSTKGRRNERGYKHTDEGHVSPRGRSGNNDDAKGSVKTHETGRRSSRHGRTREKSTVDGKGNIGYNLDTEGHIETGENQMGQSMTSDTFLSLKSNENYERSRTSLNRHSDDKIDLERRSSWYNDNEGRGLIDRDRDVVWHSMAPSSASVQEKISETSQRSIGIMCGNQAENAKSDDGVDAKRVYNDHSVDEYVCDRSDSYRSIPQSAQSLSVNRNLSGAVSEQQSTRKDGRDKSSSENKEIYPSERRHSAEDTDVQRTGLMESGRSSVLQSVGSEIVLSHSGTASSTSSWSILDREISTARSDDSIGTQGECYSFSWGEGASGRSLGSYTLQNLNSESQASEIRPTSTDAEVYLSDEGGQSILDKEMAGYQTDSLSDTPGQALQTSDAASSHVSLRGSLFEDPDIFHVKGNTPPRAASDSLRNSSRGSSSKSTRHKSIRSSSSEGSKGSVTSTRRFYSSSSSDIVCDEERPRADKQTGGTIAECQKENSEERNMQNKSSLFFPHLKMSVPGFSLPRYLTPTCKSVENISWTVFPTSSRSCPSLNMSPIRRLTKWSYSSTMASPDMSDGGWRMLITVVTYFCFFFTAFVILASALDTKNLSFSDCSKIFFEDIYKNLEYKHINGACF